MRKGAVPGRAPVVGRLALLVLWVGALVAWGQVLPDVLGWASRREGWLVPTLVGWLAYATPALVAGLVMVRWALLERHDREPRNLERWFGRLLIGLGVVLAVPFLPGRLASTRENWERMATGHGPDFERALTWTLFGEVAIIVVSVFVVLRRIQGRDFNLHLAGAAILLPAPILTLGALLVAGR